MLETILAPGPVALVAYMLAIYMLVAVYKRAVEAAAKKFKAAAAARELYALAPLIVGAATGPAIMPFLFELSGAAAITVPTAAAMLLGVAAGALSGSAWKISHDLIALRRYLPGLLGLGEPRE